MVEGIRSESGPNRFTRRRLLAGGFVGAAAILVSGCGTVTTSTAGAAVAAGPAGAAGPTFAVTHTDTEWHRLLTPEQYSVLRQAGTEVPFTSPLLTEERVGTFDCAGCDLPLFSSTTKFDSQTGWPSFWAPLDKGVGTATDTSLGMERMAVYCSNCGGHLGHLFTDGPKPTGLRYCMNGVAMTFKPAAT